MNGPDVLLGFDKVLVVFEIHEHSFAVSDLLGFERLEEAFGLRIVIGIALSRVPARRVILICISACCNRITYSELAY